MSCDLKKEWLSHPAFFFFFFFFFFRFALMLFNFNISFQSSHAFRQSDITSKLKPWFNSILSIAMRYLSTKGIAWERERERDTGYHMIKMRYVSHVIVQTYHLLLYHNK
jgi:hypothetical protein